jgi:prepilin-type N-terminal cleavage/methylation domain-containing protein
MLMSTPPVSLKVIHGAGFTLVELLIAMTILSVALLGIAGMFPASSEHLRLGSDVTKATALAQQMVEALRDQPFAAVSRYDAADTRAAAAFPPDDPADMPPFRGASLLTRWQQAIAAAPELGGLRQGWGRIAVAPLDRNLLSVTVTVGWAASPADRTIELTTFIGQR